jgi:ABC-type multidrug transport system ATPase subunit
VCPGSSASPDSPRVSNGSWLWLWPWPARLGSWCSVFLTTHDLTGIEGIADQVGVLKEGTLLVNEPLEVLKARYCRLIWTAPDGVSKQRIESGLQHLGLVDTASTAGANEAVVEKFSELGFDRFRQEAGVDVTRIDSRDDGGHGSRAGGAT